MEAAAAAARPVLRVAAICGSLRKASFNRGLLRAAAEVCEDSIPGLRVEQVDISDLPIINTDLETDGGFPPAVEAFRAKVCQADCFLFGAPEYNYSIAKTETPESEVVEPSFEPEVEVPVEPEEDQGEPEMVFGHFYPADPSVGDV